MTPPLRIGVLDGDDIGHLSRDDNLT